MREIIALIEELIAAGHAYEAGGDVYFSVRSYPAYGRLSGQDPDQLIEGSRVEPGEHKRDPLDFALWKTAKPDEDTGWESPWGRGRPGWHIECSAMAERYLGRQFAVHGGGRDLIFPHHENEVAQSCAVGRPFAQIWAHNGMLRLAGEKMSKSLGNIEPLHVALDEWGPETFLLFLLRAHYASPIDYTDDNLTQARAAAETLRNRLRESTDGRRTRSCDAAFRDALDDDFNTPRALALLFDAPPEAGGTVRELLDVLGLGGLAEEEPAPAELVEKAAGARAGACRARLRPCRRAARRDRRGRLGGARHRRRPAALPPWQLTSSTACTRCARRCAAGARCCGCGARNGCARPTSGCPTRRRSSRPSGWPSGPGARITRGSWPRRRRIRTPIPSELLAGDRPLLVALDEVTDPHNLGAVARVAECAGADGLLTTRRRSAAVTAAVCRASAGAVEHLPVAQVENLADTLIRSRRPGLWSYAAAGDAERRFDQHDYRDGTLFVMGSEGRGVRPRVRSACDEAVSIPMAGRIESLNVSTAAAVLLFEAVRQRRG